MSKNDESLFLSIIIQYVQTGMAALGKMPNPMTGKTDVSLDLAKYCIDVLEMMERKTKGNLSDMEQRELQTQLTNLRLNFVQESQKPQQDQSELSSEASATPADAATDEPNPSDEAPEDNGDADTSGADEPAAVDEPDGEKND